MLSFKDFTPVQYTGGESEQQDLNAMKRHRMVGVWEAAAAAKESPITESMPHSYSPTSTAHMVHLGSNSSTHPDEHAWHDRKAGAVVFTHPAGPNKGMWRAVKDTSITNKTHYAYANLQKSMASGLKNEECSGGAGDPLDPNTGEKRMIADSKKRNRLKKKPMVKVSVTKPMGYRIADIGPGGVEHNVKTGTI